MASRAAGSSFGDGHALEQFAAGEAGVDEDAGVGGGDDRGVALGAGGEDGHAHELENTPKVCEFRRTRSRGDTGLFGGYFFSPVQTPECLQSPRKVPSLTWLPESVP